MTGLRIKILKSSKPPERLWIRIKRLFSRLSVWFSQGAGGPGPQTPGTASKIRIIRSSWPANSGAFQVTAPPPAPPPVPAAGATRAIEGGISVNLGVRKCKSCGHALLDGSELAQCSRYPTHEIHRRCLGLAGHRCPDCQSAIG